LQRRIPEQSGVGEQGLALVLGGLHPREEAVEGGDVAARSGRAERVRLDERRARACERVPDEAPGASVAPEEDLDELGHVLPQVRMEPVDVLRPLPFWELGLGPRELEVDLVVESGLRAHRCFHSPPLPADLPRRL
jgi:hypothetical protein